MEFLGALWIPILVSSGLVFVVSSIVHMVLPIHQGDFDTLPSEDEVLAALREQGVGPGAYMFPGAGCIKDVALPEVMARYDQGPVGYLTVLPPGPPAVGRSMVLWFLYTLMVGVFVAYLAELALVGAAEYLRVFQFVGATAFIVYGLPAVVDSIWKGQAWSTSLKFVFDGLLYALTTAVCFAWLWPATV